MCHLYQHKTLLKLPSVSYDGVMIIQTGRCCSVSLMSLNTRFRLVFIQDQPVVRKEERCWEHFINFLIHPCTKHCGLVFWEVKGVRILSVCWWPTLQSIAEEAVRVTWKRNTASRWFIELQGEGCNWIHSWVHTQNIEKEDWSFFSSTEKGTVTVPGRPHWGVWCWGWILWVE